MNKLLSFILLAFFVTPATHADVSYVLNGTRFTVSTDGVMNETGKFIPFNSFRDRLNPLGNLTRAVTGIEKNGCVEVKVAGHRRILMMWENRKEVYKFCPNYVLFTTNVRGHSGPESYNPANSKDANAIFQGLRYLTYCDDLDSCRMD